MPDGKDEWYVSREGQRFGPVTFAELQDAARGGRLEPRSDMVYGGPLTEWKQAAEVEGLFEKRTPSVNDPATGPPPDSMADSGNYEFNGMPGELRLPGAPRIGYILGVTVLPFLIAAALVTFLPEAQSLAGETVGPYLPLLFLLVPLVMIIITVKRFQNLAMSGWWWFGLLVPLLNLWLQYRLFACPTGYAYTKRMDGIGWFLAVVFWLLMLAPIALFFLGGAEALGNLVESGKFEEIIEQVENALPALPEGDGEN